MVERKIVLTSERTLMSSYHSHLFLGFAATLPRGRLPDWVYYSLLCPIVDANADGSARFAPYGLRKVEASLLVSGFHRDDVIVAHPMHLSELLGPKTLVVGLTANDPLGIGPATSTFRELMGGVSYMEHNLRALLETIRGSTDAKIVLGGPGAWQLADEETMDDLGIDHVVVGEGEKVVPKLFGDLVQGRSAPRVVEGQYVLAEEIPIIAQPSVAGLVEVARGCGRGCRFCIPAMRRLRSIPLEKIVAEVSLNLRAGQQPILHSEDVLAYGSRGSRISPERIKELLGAVLSIPGVHDLAVSHFSVSSIVQADSLLEEINEKIRDAKEREGRGDELKSRFIVSGQVGIETGSPRLIREFLPGKPKPFRSEEWPDMVRRCFDLLSEHRWLACATLIVGLPGETPQDIELTLELVESLKGHIGLLVPLFYVDINNRGRGSFRLADLTPLHGELFMKCWLHTLRSVPYILGPQMIRRLSGPTSKVGVRLLVELGTRIGLRAVSVCERQYGWDLRKMVEDINGGRLNAVTFRRPLAPFPRIGGRIRSSLSSRRRQAV